MCSTERRVTKSRVTVESLAYFVQGGFSKLLAQAWHAGALLLGSQPCCLKGTPCTLLSDPLLPIHLLSPARAAVYDVVESHTTSHNRHPTSHRVHTRTCDALQSGPTHTFTPNNHGGEDGPICDAPPALHPRPLSSHLTRPSIYAADTLHATHRRRSFANSACTLLASSPPSSPSSPSPSPLPSAAPRLSLSWTPLPLYLTSSTSIVFSQIQIIDEL